MKNIDEKVEYIFDDDTPASGKHSEKAKATYMEIQRRKTKHKLDIEGYVGSSFIKANKQKSYGFYSRAV